MNENYLRFLTSYYTDSPIIDPSWLLENYFIPVRPDYSFLDKKLKPHRFIPEKRVFTINLENMCDEEMEYFKRRLIESLRVPTQYFHNIEPTDYFDEYH